MVGLPITAVFGSVVTALVMCCAGKRKKQRRYEEETKDLAQREPVYDAPVAVTRTNAGMVLKKNVCYSNKHYIR